MLHLSPQPVPKIPSQSWFALKKDEFYVILDSVLTEMTHCEEQHDVTGCIELIKLLSESDSKPLDQKLIKTNSQQRGSALVSDDQRQLETAKRRNSSSGSFSSSAFSKICSKEMRLKQDFVGNRTTIHAGITPEISKKVVSKRQGDMFSVKDKELSSRTLACINSKSISTYQNFVTNSTLKYKVNDYQGGPKSCLQNVAPNQRPGIQKRNNFIAKSSHTSCPKRPWGKISDTGSDIPKTKYPRRMGSDSRQNSGGSRADQSDSGAEVTGATTTTVPSRPHPGKISSSHDPWSDLDPTKDYAWTAVDKSMINEIVDSLLVTDSDVMTRRGDVILKESRPFASRGADLCRTITDICGDVDSCGALRAKLTMLGNAGDVTVEDVTSDFVTYDGIKNDVIASVKLVDVTHFNEMSFKWKSKLLWRMNNNNNNNNKHGNNNKNSNSSNNNSNGQVPQTHRSKLCST